MKQIDITIKAGEVLKEVVRRAYVLGQVATDDERMRWLLQGVGDCGKREMVDNAIRDGWEIVLQAMSPYIVKRSETSDENGMVEQLALVAQVADNSRIDIEQAAKRSIVRVLEHSAMAVWKQINVQDGSEENASASSEAWKLKVLMNTRVGVQRLDKRT